MRLIALTSSESVRLNVQGSEREGFVHLGSLLNPAIRTILVKGDPGTGKTLLALELLKRHGGGVYFSSRVSQEGIFDQYPEAKALLNEGRIRVVKSKKTGAKFEDIRLSTASLAIESILDLMQKSDSPLLILDSWDTIAKELDSVERMRTEKARLTIADANKGSIVFVSEEPTSANTDYAVDAIVTLKDELFEQRRVRRMEWNKLRGSEIPQKTYLFSLAGSRFNVFQPIGISPPKSYKAGEWSPIRNTSESYSTGSQDLDALTGGGMKKGARILLELGKYVGADWHLPLTTCLSCNFLANGGCSMSIPTSGLVPQEIKESRLRYLPAETVESSLRIGHFGEIQSADPCFLELNPNSEPESFELFWKAAGEIRNIAHKNNSGSSMAGRPCLMMLGIDRIESVFGHEAVRSDYLRSATMTASYEDVAIFIAKQSTKGKEELADLVDLYLKLDEINGALTIYSLKPPSRIYHMEYDFTRGYPHVKLTPVV